MTKVLACIAEHSMNRIEELLPWNIDAALSLIGRFSADNHWPVLGDFRGVGHSQTQDGDIATSGLDIWDVSKLTIPILGTA